MKAPNRSDKAAELVERLEDIAGRDLVGGPAAGDLGPEGGTLMPRPSQPLGDIDTVQGCRFDGVEKALDSSVDVGKLPDGPVVRVHTIG